jgi:predicted amidophosphoribosyltransferase
MKTFLTSCVSCHGTTSKSYARKHEGKCKTCVTGIEPKYHGPTCPQCGAPISAYKAQHHYVCESCVKNNDPVGWANEVRGFND